MGKANPDTSARTARRVAIVGGGLSGAATAVQLVRASPVALQVTIVEPAAEAVVAEDAPPAKPASTRKPAAELTTWLP